MPPSPMITTFACLGNSAIALDSAISFVACLARSACGEIDGNAAERRLLVLRIHLFAGLSDRLDAIVKPCGARLAAETTLMAPIALRSMQGIGTRSPFAELDRK